MCGKLKGFAHGWKQALIADADADACEACGRCVTACPEKAITLARRDATQKRRRRIDAADLTSSW